MTEVRMIVSLLVSAFLLAAPASAVDGQILINNAKALAGNVTPGDTPGYPVTLTVPGSYKLSGNLAPPAGVNGIDVITPDVTIDFNGFRMHGSHLALIGIRGPQRYLTVRNGTIMGFTQFGIYAGGADLIVENMRISENGLYGVYVSSVYGVYARIVNSTITFNTLVGIYCSYSCHIEGNYIAANGNGQFATAGLRLDSGTILGNTIQANNIHGISRVGSGSVGFGNNSILNNGQSVQGGNFNILHPNYCSPAC